MSVVVLFLIAAAIGWIELPKIVRARNRKELVSFIIILVLGLLYLCDWQFHLMLPNPTEAMNRLFRPVTIWLESLLL
ncbi:MAG: hypothetical protein J7639_30670 [Paenibacillaceae bacterium]|nr:hypothetical protein [Paenibacillaceae bacterium]